MGKVVQPLHVSNLIRALDASPAPIRRLKFRNIYFLDWLLSPCLYPIHEAKFAWSFDIPILVRLTQAPNAQLTLRGSSSTTEYLGPPYTSPVVTGTTGSKFVDSR
jgi:hypothetical protein